MELSNYFETFKPTEECIVWCQEQLDIMINNFEYENVIPVLVSMISLIGYSFIPDEHKWMAVDFSKYLLMGWFIWLLWFK